MGDGLPARPVVRRAQDPHPGGHRSVQSVLSGPGSALLVTGHGRRWDAGSGSRGNRLSPNDPGRQRARVRLA